MLKVPLSDYPPLTLKHRSMVYFSSIATIAYVKILENRVIKTTMWSAQTNELKSEFALFHLTKSICHLKTVTSEEHKKNESREHI